MSVCFIHSIPPAGFGHSRGHPQGSALQWIDVSRFYTISCSVDVYILCNAPPWGKFRRYTPCI